MTFKREKKIFIPTWTLVYIKEIRQILDNSSLPHAFCCLVNIYVNNVLFYRFPNMCLSRFTSVSDKLLTIWDVRHHNLFLEDSNVRFF